MKKTIATVLLLFAVLAVAVSCGSGEAPNYDSSVPAVSDILADNPATPEIIPTETGDVTTQTPVNTCTHPDKSLEVYAQDEVLPTCTQPGRYNTKKCKDCGEIIPGAEIAPLGHDYVDGACSRCKLAQTESTGLAFTKSEDGKSYILSGVGTCTDVVILVPAKNDGLPVTAVAPGAFRLKNGISAIVFGENVKTIGTSAFEGCVSLRRVTLFGAEEIGDLAFSGCRDLEAVVLSEGLKTIGTSAFVNCAAIKTLTLPDSVQTLGDNAFQNCAGITELTIGSGLKNTGSAAFAECTALSKVTFKSGVEIIGTAAFRGCAAIKDLALPATLKVIGSSAFSGCSSLSEIELPDAVTEIGDLAFYQCEDVRTMKLPKNLTTLGVRVFSGMSKLDECTLPDGAAGFRMVEGCLISAGGTLYYGTHDAHVPSDGSVKAIADYAFEGNETILRVDIPDGVKTIGKRAFAECSELITITVSGDVEYIGEEAFALCESLGDPDAGFIAFYEKTGGTGSLEICDRAFAGCEVLENVTLPTHIARAGVNIFADCDELVKAGLTNGAKFVPDYLFYGCKSLEQVELPGSIEKIGGNAFAGCEALTGVTLPASLVEIGANAFLGCESLETITIPASLTTAGWHIFEGCDELKTAVVAEGATTIPAALFGGCEELTEITLPASITANVRPALEQIEGLKTINFTGADIPAGVCKDLTTLEEVTLPNAVSIGEEAFAGCYNLEKIELPTSLTSIGSSAFEGCEDVEPKFLGTQQQWQAVTVAEGNEDLTKDLTFA